MGKPMLTRNNNYSTVVIQQNARKRLKAKLKNEILKPCTVIMLNILEFNI